MYTNIGNTELSKIKSNFYRYIRKKKMLMLIKEGKLNQYKNMELDFKEAFEVYPILKNITY